MLQFNYEMPKWLKNKVNAYIIKNNEFYQKSSKRIGPMNLNNLYNSNLKNENKTIISGNYDPHKYADPKKKFDKYKEPSFFSMDHKQYLGLEDVIDLKKLDKMKSYDTGSIKVYKI